MDFPPVSNLVSATFDQLSTKPNNNGTPTSPVAPQPVANGKPVDDGASSRGINPSVTSHTNRVGTVLSEKA